MQITCIKFFVGIFFKSYKDEEEDTNIEKMS